ncbi:MAG TPA: adenylate/guanylate cyclase domain-containing protein, partial [Candidatus Ozemobacteraceae bacterium]|nr:adenylate/guanylate cyclase domain-containing protein [Candidatus Ozemobacteraceae bacterium]
MQNIATRFVNQDTAYLVRFISRLEKQIPDAVRWVAWDSNRNLIELPSQVSLPGSRRWEKIIQDFFANPDVPTHREPERRNQLEQQLQALVGPRLRATDILVSRGEAVFGEFLGKTCLVYWVNWLLPDGKQPSPTTCVSGFFAVVFLDKLPNNFWSRMAFSGYAPADFRDLSFPCALITTNPSRHVLQPPLPRTRRFVARLQAEFSRTRTVHALIDDWMAVPLPIHSSKNEQIFVFKNLQPVLQSSRNAFRSLQTALLLLLTIGMTGVWVLKSGAGLNLSLHWRIAGYFLLAVGLPMFGLVQATITIGRYQFDELRERLLKRMRESALLMERLSNSYAPTHAQQMALRVSDFCHNSKSLSDMHTHLQQLVQSRAVSNYFLSDDSGNLAFVGQPAVDRYYLTMMKTVLRDEMIKQIGSHEETGRPLGELMIDEVGKGAQVIESGEGNLLSRPGRWEPFRLSRTNAFVMRCLVWLSGKPHVLVLVAHEVHLEQPLFRQEVMKQRFVSEDRLDSIELAFSSRSPYEWPHLPPSSPLCLNSQVTELLNAEAEAEFDIDLASETFLLYAPARSNRIYRPIFFTSLSQVYALAEARRRQLFLTAGAALGVALLLGLLLASRLLGPIRRIDEALGLVTRGDLDIELPVESRDEIGHISETFNQMVSGLRERKRMQAYVSDAVLAAVKDTANTRWQAGEVIEATILFSDIRGFTTLCEAQTPEVMFSLLNDFLGGIEPVLSRFHGEVDKFIGDAVMAVFRTPGPDQALQAVHAALAMKEYLSEFNAMRVKSGLFPINIGIGISTGRVMQGDVGSQRRKDLTVIGDEVNLAARLETASKTGLHTQIVISESMWNLVRSQVETVEMPSTTVKGKQQTVR